MGMSSTPRWLSGWRVGALFAAAGVLVSLIINTTTAAVLPQRISFTQGLGQLSVGNCDHIQKVDTLVHLAINILSTFMLSGSNYVMQVLVGPTRQEIDRAHKKRSWLDIGRPSVRNLTKISISRTLLWLILGVSSIPLHLIFNSAFYSSLAANNYNVFVVSPSFVDGAKFTFTNGINGSTNFTTPPIAQLTGLQQNLASLQNLSNIDCINAYANEFNTEYRNLIVVSSDHKNGSSLLSSTNYSFNSSMNGHRAAPWITYWWVCSSVNCPSYVDFVRQRADKWRPLGFQASYCLSEKVEAKCSFNANLDIVAVVTAINTIKLAVILYVLFFYNSAPILVVGDAIQSFLDTPDNVTTSQCLLTRHDAIQKRRLAAKSAQRSQYTQIPKCASTKRERWHSAVSKLHWIITLFMLLGCLGAGVGFYSFGWANLGGPSWSEVRDSGFGQVHMQALINADTWIPDQLQQPSSEIITNVLIANSPQLILSRLYLTINSLLTAMYTADEWSDFALQRKTLRISHPRGEQRSTYFLQLPYKVALPLMAVSTVLHWLVSQSFFVVVVTEWSEYGDLISLTALATCGWSLLPQLIAMIIGGVMFIVLIVILFRRYNAFIPLVSGCSLAIAASCHVASWEENPALKPLQWGVVRTARGLSNFEICLSDGDLWGGHCCFTSCEVESPVDGKYYS